MQKFDLKSLAEDWDKMFVDLIEQKKTNPINPYSPTPPYKTKSQELMNKHVKLNIAAGPNVFPFDGWVNYDKESFKSYFEYISNPQTGTFGMPDYQKPLANYLQDGGKLDFRVQDCTEPFNRHMDNSVDLIYCGQFIEHLNPIYQAPQFITECFRMLRKLGVLRLTTPDLDKLINAYKTSTLRDFASDQPDFYKSAEPSMQLALIMFGASGPQCTQRNYEGHQCIYTVASLTKLLKGVGFSYVEFFDGPGKSRSPIMQNEVLDAGVSHSLICEAIK